MQVVPDYPESRPIAIGDKSWLDAIFARIQPRVSELTFANLYLYRHVHAYRLTMADGALVVLGQGYDGSSYFLPPLAGDAAGAIHLLLAQGWPLYGADEEFAAACLQGVDLEISADRDSFDYLYLRRELAELHGNRFHKKRHAVNQILANHDCRVERYGPAFRRGALDLLGEWRRRKAGDASPSLALEAGAAREALELADQIGLEGLVVLVGGDVKSFILGGRLNDDTSVCHVLKAAAEPKGLYQLIYQEFNRRLFADCTYHNLEQDLGLSNLRWTKLSYHPVALVKKYRARLCSAPFPQLAYGAGDASHHTRFIITGPTGRFGRDVSSRCLKKR